MSNKQPIKCFLLDHGYTTQTSSPCCQILDFLDLRDENNRRTVSSFSTLHQHPRWIEIKSSMDAGEWHPSCRSCADLETKGLESMRINHNRYFQSIKGGEGLVNLTVWVGNQCNLQCRSCNPNCSSSWLDEYQKMPESLSFPLTLLSNENYDHTYDDFSCVNNVILTGGEPIYNKKCFPLLDKIGDQTQGKCSLTIVTNCTIPIDYKNFSFLKKYESVNFLCSIDAIDMAFEFIRTGGKWAKVKRNIENYAKQKINLSYHITHSALNLFDVFPASSWLEEQGIRDCGLQTFVTNVPHLSYSIFTDDEKKLFQQWFDQQDFGEKERYILETLMKAEFNSILRQKFFLYMEHTKQFHGMDWKIYLPKLYDLMHS